MAKLSLKETFLEAKILDDGTIDEGLAGELAGAGKQLIGNKLKNFMKKGELKLTEPSLKLLKKLNKLGVKKMFGQDIEQVIRAAEYLLNQGDTSLSKNDLTSTIQQLMQARQTPGSKTNKKNIKRRRKRKESAYNLSSVFSENEEKAVETPEEKTYTQPDVEYTPRLDDDSEDESPETPIQDDADDKPQVSEEELSAALTHDILHYGEHDPFLED